ncbi:hypothetical protein SDRG_11005 [Saprolegnia diclina VS20]|uniref:Uncharacterized protein n=1 Tax=Saprolegnia diclina (strain VS20) TaxID=1156394 RepID=T0Q0P5_SAPDV|nr:hypothetical protein SDRG_11005 [Saprolegnia diclina VS20]EQC31404.1 hypothetical protein SDRG_11005 [Saprolegnia diclina VS20]|eukprot:XP_008615245.1 hypothetical protein SDRG_11005 [Saprolegnia diclina VS20]
MRRDDCRPATEDDFVYLGDDDDDDDPIEDELRMWARFRRRRFFKSGLSTYEEYYSRNETGRRLGRFSLHMRLNEERPTITILLGNRSSRSRPSVVRPTTETPRRVRSSSLDANWRVSKCGDVLRPKLLADPNFSFFQHRSISKVPRQEQTREPTGTQSLLSRPTSMPDVTMPSPQQLRRHCSSPEVFFDAQEPPLEYQEADNVRSSTPEDPRPSDERRPSDYGEGDDEPSPLYGDTQEDAGRFRSSDATYRPSDLDKFRPSGMRESSFSSNYNPVTIRNSVTHNVNVVAFLGGFKGSSNRRSTRSSLDQRPSFDSYRLKRSKKTSPSVPDTSFGKRLRDARNRIPPEFRDDLPIAPVLVQKPPRVKKSVQFRAENEVFVFEKQDPIDDDDDVYVVELEHDL